MIPHPEDHGGVPIVKPRRPWMPDLAFAVACVAVAMALAAVLVLR